MRQFSHVQAIGAGIGAVLIVVGVALMLFAHRHVYTGVGLVIVSLVIMGYAVLAYRRAHQPHTSSRAHPDR